MRNLKILLAQHDQADQRRVTAALIEDRPFVDVRAVSTGEEFTHYFSRQAFDCGIVASDLPDRSAAELLRQIGDVAAGCPVLVVSAGDRTSDVIACYRNGATDVVTQGEAAAAEGLWSRVDLAVRLTRSHRRERRRCERRRRQLSRLAETDPLTGLYNRRFLTQQLQSQAFHRDRRRTIACVLMDLDHFKDVNDNYGHRAGDAVLKSFARQIRSDLTGGDIALRWGGEEFLILRRSSDLSGAWIWAEQLRQRLASLQFRAGRREFAVTASMGVVSLPTARMGHEMIDMADKALYLAKRRGRDRVCTYPMVLVDEALSRIESRSSTSPIVRRRRLLQECKGILGPTQIEHVSSHCDLVERAAADMGRAMGLAAGEIRRVKTAGLIHDLGKCVIPESMLAQTEPLSPQQWRLMHRRSEFAAQMGRRLGFEPGAIDYVRRHSRVGAADGGKSAPLGAMLVGAADAVVAMRSKRAYRPARRTDEVLAEMLRASWAPIDAATIRSVCAASHEEYFSQ